MINAGAHPKIVFWGQHISSDGYSVVTFLGRR